MANSDNKTSLRSLVDAEAGGRIFLGKEVHNGPVRRAYEQAIGGYREFAFWRRGLTAGYRRKGTLWLPQRRAVCFIHAYLASRSVKDAPREAALVKMPTGTGKTAVIAATACLSPSARRVLIITPRVALVQQMREDLCYSFWRKLDAIFLDDGLSEGLDAEEIELRASAIRRSRRHPIHTLISDQYKQIWDRRDAERLIVVGTFNALHAVLGLVPPAHNSMYGRDTRKQARVLGTLREDDEGPREKVEDASAFRSVLESMDLVIVDEGHYEPAYSWRQAVKVLSRPTVIFSATPYRNDFKYFEIQGRYVFNLPWQEAVSRKLIRRVEVREPLGAEVGTFRGRVSERASRKSPRRLYSEKTFVRQFKSTLLALPEGKKAIVHAATFDSLKRLQVAFRTIAKTSAVLIHDRIRPTDSSNPDLQGLPKRVREELSCLRFRHVRDAAASDAALSSPVWIHQYKLLEGIDHDRFVEVWLYDGFGSARQVIQQIGRAVRRPDLKDPGGQVAVIRGSAMPLEAYAGSPTVAAQLCQRWADYLAYEQYAASSDCRAFTAETQLLASLKRTAPDVQYIAGEFRGGHLLDEAPTMAAFLLPRRGKICRVDGVVEHHNSGISDKALDKLQAASAEAMVLEERFDIVPVPAPETPGYEDIRLIRYLAWSNSKFLATHHLPEWRLGVMSIARAGRYIVLLDTEGLCVDTSRLGLLAPEPEELRRLFPERIPIEPERSSTGDTRIVEVTASGLDTSEAGIRSMSIRKSLLDESYFDLAESSQVPTSVQGTGPLDEETVRRRLSFFRGSVSDATSRLVPVREYARWTRTVGDILADDSTAGHAFFRRFAQEVPPLQLSESAPRSILLDLWDILDIPTEVAAHKRWDSAVAAELLEADTCLDVEQDEDEDTGEVAYRFNFAGATLEIKYDLRESVPPTARYRIVDADDNLDERLSASDAEPSAGDFDPEDQKFGRRLSASLIRQINQQQSFRVVPSTDQVVYAHGHFFRPEIAEDILAVIEPCGALSRVVSEKGDTRLSDAGDWEASTLFGRVFGWFDGQAGTCDLSKDLGNADVLVCDDRGRETADFYAIDRTHRRVFVIHAKAENEKQPRSSARKLQEIARQAQSSLAFAGTVRHPLPVPKAWAQDWSVILKDASGATISRPRILSDDGPMTPSEAGGELNAVLSDRRYTTEVVMLVAGSLSVSAARTAFERRGVHDLQFLYLLASLRTTFDRAGVPLRIVANP